MIKFAMMIAVSLFCASSLAAAKKSVQKTAAGNAIGFSYQLGEGSAHPGTQIVLSSKKTKHSRLNWLTTSVGGLAGGGPLPPSAFKAYEQQSLKWKQELTRFERSRAPASLCREVVGTYFAGRKHRYCVDTWAKRAEFSQWLAQVAAPSGARVKLHK